MRAGDLRDRVTIQRNLDARSGSGAVLDQFEDWLTRIAAKVENITGGERWAQAQPIADVTTRIRIRYRAGLTPKMRVKHERGSGSPTLVDLYDVEAVIPADSRSVEVFLMCRKRDAEGFRTGER